MGWGGDGERSMQLLSLVFCLLGCREDVCRCCGKVAESTIDHDGEDCLFAVGWPVQGISGVVTRLWYEFTLAVGDGLAVRRSHMLLHCRRSGWRQVEVLLQLAIQMSLSFLWSSAIILGHCRLTCAPLRVKESRLMQEGHGRTA